MGDYYLELKSNAKGVAFRKQKYYVSPKERFLKRDGVKSNDENMMKNNDGILSPHGNENEGRCFLCDSLNKSILSKK